MAKQEIKVEFNYPLHWEWGVEISEIFITNFKPKKLTF